MGVQPMICNVSMNFDFIGGQSLDFAIDALQTAVDFNYYANSTYYKNYMNGKPGLQQTIQSNYEKNKL